LPLPLHAVGRWRQAVGAHAARRLPAFIEQCTARAQHHLPRLRALPGVTVLDDPAGAHGSWPFFFLLLPDQRRRDAALDQLWQAGLGVSRLFIHALPDYAYLAGIVPACDVPNARDFAARSLTIGNGELLGALDFDGICRTLMAVLSHSGNSLPHGRKTVPPHQIAGTSGHWLPVPPRMYPRRLGRMCAVSSRRSLCADSLRDPRVARLAPGFAKSWHPCCWPVCCWH